MGSLFLGLDSSTQSFSAVLIDLATRRVILEESVNFSADLPDYQTQSGILRRDDPMEVHAPPLMWAAALDLLMERLVKRGAPLGEILAISGSGQQHGSVYSNAGFAAVISGLEASKSLAEQLSSTLTRRTSPIWMDSSTQCECQEIQTALGGAAALAAATGSAAFERFTGPQIRKFSKRYPETYSQTARIDLVSSWLCSILSGTPAPIDHGDGAGMNLMDIRTRQWHPQALAATAPDLAKKLPALAEPWKVVGPVSGYFVKKYKVNPAALSLVWSGDNPCSVIGTGLVEAGMVAISLGTSDTYFGTMPEARSDPRGEGHVFVSPTGDYMTLICFKNGSLAREKIRDQYGLDWAGFSAALAQTPPGNHGALMLPWFEPEIVPRVLAAGVRRENLAPDAVAANCRAVVEAQMLSMKLHSQWMGIEAKTIRATGGGASNTAILQIMADVMGCPVVQFEVSKSAALGAALRAAHGWHHQRGEKTAWSRITEGFTAPKSGGSILPQREAVGIYAEKLRQFARFEAAALGT